MPTAKRPSKIIAGESRTRCPTAESLVRTTVDDFVARARDLKSKTPITRGYSEIASTFGLQVASWTDMLIAMGRMMRQALPDPPRTLERSALRRLNAKLDDWSVALHQLPVTTGHALAARFEGDDEDVFVRDLSHIDHEITRLREAITHALTESKNAGSGTRSDEIARVVAGMTWNMLADANVYSDASSDSPYAKVLDVVIPAIGSRVSVATILASRPVEMTTIPHSTVKAGGTVPKVPTLGERIGDSTT